MMVDFKFDSHHRAPTEVGIVEKFILVGGAVSWVCHPYIESVTTLSDVDDEEITIISGYVWRLPPLS